MSLDNKKHISFLPSSVKNSIRSKIKNLVIISFMGMGLLMLLSLLTYNSNDSSFNSLNSDENIQYGNMLGFMGSYVSDILLQIFGYSSYLLSVFPIIWGVIMIKNSLLIKYNKFLSLFGLMITFSVVLGTLPVIHALKSPVSYGGITGSFFISWLDRTHSQLLEILGKGFLFIVGSFLVYLLFKKSFKLDPDQQQKIINRSNLESHKSLMPIPFENLQATSTEFNGDPSFTSGTLSALDKLSIEKRKELEKTIDVDKVSPLKTSDVNAEDVPRGLLRTTDNDNAIEKTKHIPTGEIFYDNPNVQVVIPTNDDTSNEVSPIRNPKSTPLVNELINRLALRLKEMKRTHKIDDKKMVESHKIPGFKPSISDISTPKFSLVKETKPLESDHDHMDHHDTVDHDHEHMDHIESDTILENAILENTVIDNPVIENPMITDNNINLQQNSIDELDIHDLDMQYLDMQYLDMNVISESETPQDTLFLGFEDPLDSHMEITQDSILSGLEDPLEHDMSLLDSHMDITQDSILSGLENPLDHMALLDSDLIVPQKNDIMEELKNALEPHTTIVDQDIGRSQGTDIMADLHNALNTHTTTVDSNTDISPQSIMEELKSALDMDQSVSLPLATETLTIEDHRDTDDTMDSESIIPQLNNELNIVEGENDMASPLVDQKTEEIERLKEELELLKLEKEKVELLRQKSIYENELKQAQERHQELNQELNEVQELNQVQELNELQSVHAQPEGVQDYNELQSVTSQPEEVQDYNELQSVNSQPEEVQNHNELQSVHPQPEDVQDYNELQSVNPQPEDVQDYNELQSVHAQPEEVQYYNELQSVHAQPEDVQDYNELQLATSQPEDVQNYNELQSVTSQPEDVQYYNELQSVTSQPEEVQNYNELQSVTSQPEGVQDYNELQSVNPQPEDVQYYNELQSVTSQPEGVQDYNELQSVNPQPEEVQNHNELQSVHAQPEGVQDYNELQSVTSQPEGVQDYNELQSVTSQPEGVQDYNELQSATSQPEDVQNYNELQSVTSQPEEVQNYNELQSVTSQPEEVQDYNEVQSVNPQPEEVQNHNEVQSVNPQPKVLDFSQLQQINALHSNVAYNDNAPQAEVEQSEAMNIKSLSDAQTQDIEKQMRELQAVSTPIQEPEVMVIEPIDKPVFEAPKIPEELLNNIKYEANDNSLINTPKEDNQHLLNPFENGMVSNIATLEVTPHIHKLDDDYNHKTLQSDESQTDGSQTDGSQTHAITTSDERPFILPHSSFLDEFDEDSIVIHNELDLAERAKHLEEALRHYKIKGEVMNVQPGPVVTLFEFEPYPGTKTSKVVNLAEDIARSLSAVSVRIAPIPGKSVIGIEMPNDDREMVNFRELVEDPAFSNAKGALPFILGKDIGGSPKVADLATMPHLLVSGTTGSGKSVAINAIIMSLLYRFTPDELRLVMVDPKMLEFAIYEDIPHLLTPIVTESDKAINALQWAMNEMNNRYRLMADAKVRNIEGFNKKMMKAIDQGETLYKNTITGFNRETGQNITEKQEMEMKKLPYIAIIIDELADLMITAGKEVEPPIQSLAQKARAAGIHLILATQRPSVNVITGTIKANFPSRMSFQLTSRIDSRTILDENGAEQLLGRGDMLYKGKDSKRPIRLHGPFVSDDEVEKTVEFLKSQGEPFYIQLEPPMAEPTAVEPVEHSEKDPLYDQAVEAILQDGKASTSFVQRKLKIGYNRAARIIEEMEADGIVSPADRVGRRTILAS